MAERRSRKTREDEESSTPLLEWVAGSVGAILFAGALFVLASEGMSRAGPPAIEARVLERRAQGGMWLVEFEAKNTGDRPAEAVKFTVTLEGGERGLGTTREVIVDFIGPHSTRRAGVFFDVDPVGREIAIEAQGYLEP